MALFLFVALTVMKGMGQSTEMAPAVKHYPFVREELNMMIHPESLDGVMEKLVPLKKEGRGTLRILHIGDSHLQADYLTQTIRTILQREFGNSGRGLVVPYRIARTNEPESYRSTSSALWQSKRCVFPNQPLPIGVGGVTISTADTGGRFSIYVKDDSLLNYGFNKVTLFCQKDSASFQFTFKDSLGQPIGSMLQNPDEWTPFTCSTILPSLHHQMQFNVLKTGPQQSSGTVYGVLLENGNSGILYNMVGVNGAEFRHYSEAKYFAEQTRALHPDLIILSLATNEAYSTGFTSTKFYSDIETLYNQLKTVNPDAAFLITTPACSYRRKKPNLQLPVAAKTILHFAKDHQIACWDLQGITGGSNSAYNWRKYHLLRPDYVHYTIPGYRLQGSLFCNAFLKTYQTYVADRPD